MRRLAQDDEIDELLEQAGRQWRSVQPPPPAITKHRRGPGPLALGGVGIVALVAILLSAVAVRSPDRDNVGNASTRPSGTSVSQSTGIIETGDAVVASGNVLRETEPGDLVLCQLGPTPYSLEIPLQCPPTRVIVRGLDLTSLPGWRQFGGIWASSHVRVAGTWDGGSIVVHDIQEANEVALVRLRVPCSWEPSAWPGNGNNADAVEAAADHRTRGRIKSTAI